MAPTLPFRVRPLTFEQRPVRLFPLEPGDRYDITVLANLYNEAVRHVTSLEAQLEIVRAEHRQLRYEMEIGQGKSPTVAPMEAVP